jgi:Mn-dependent DtxR family transcriptional regulator
MESVIVASKNDLVSAIRQVMSEIEAERKIDENTKTISIHQFSQRIGRSHYTVKKLAEKGIINLTADGRIRLTELERYLNNE